MIFIYNYRKQLLFIGKYKQIRCHYHISYVFYGSEWDREGYNRKLLKQLDNRMRVWL